MAIRRFLASNVFFCLTKGLVNILFIFIAIFSASLMERMHWLGIAAMFSAVFGIVRGVADSDDWGPKIQNVFPGLVHFLCGVLLFSSESADKQDIYLPLVILFMLEAVIGVILSNEIKDYFRYWWISIVGIIMAIFLSIAVVPGDRLSDANIQPFIGIFLFFEALLFLWILLIERKMSIEYNRPLKDFRNDPED
jgi:uncharacterized membrane protein HdeD (DUF308 family)